MLNDFRSGNDPLARGLGDFNRGVVQQNTADPRVQQMYGEYLQAGSPYGYMSPERFAYEYASHGFTRDGMARRRAADGANAVELRRTWDGVREAEDDRRDAQGGWMGGYRANSSGMADVSRGLQERPDIYGGTTPVPYIEHGAPWVSAGPAPRQGADGRWYQQAQDGNWYPMPGQ